MRSITKNPAQIRHVFILSSPPSKNLPLIDSLLQRMPHPHPFEEKKTNDSKSTAFPVIPIHYQYNPNPSNNNEIKPYLINLLHSSEPLHYTSELVSNLTIADGGLLVVDGVEGLSNSLDSLLTYTLAERVKPVLMINNISRCITEFKQDPEMVYQSIARVIESVNLSISMTGQNDALLSPEKGNVAFEYGQGCFWSFTVPKFASLYSKKLNIDAAKLSTKLWGDHFYNPENSTWTTSQVNDKGTSLNRGFVEFILKPVIKVTQCIMAGQEENIRRMTSRMDIKLSPEESELHGTALLEIILSKWINSADTLLEMVIIHLPSPATAQKYRTSILYEGPQNGEYGTSMRECDPKGPLLMHVSRMIPSSEKGRFYSFGRVFSGTVSTGQSVRIIGPDHAGKEVPALQIEKIIDLASASEEGVEQVQCGSLVAIVGTDQHILKTATISDRDYASRIRTPKGFSLSLFKLAVIPKLEGDLPQLMNGLKLLAKYEPLVQVIYEETGEHFIVGVDEKHVKMCLDILQTKFTTCEIKAFDPVVTYKETVTQLSETYSIKSANRRNTFFCTAQPLPNGLMELYDKGQIGLNINPKQRDKILNEDFGWTTTETNGLWAFGSEQAGLNAFIDMTKDVTFLSEIQENVVSAFRWATREGALCEENMRQIRINLIDANLHADPLRRGAGQVMPAIRRLSFGCQLSARPRLQEPMFIQEIITIEENLIHVYRSLWAHRVIILDIEEIDGTSLIRVTILLPGVECSNYESLLGNLGVYTMLSEPVFSDWEIVDSDPLEIGSYANKVVTQVRKRKGLKEEIPDLTYYNVVNSKPT